MCVYCMWSGGGGGGGGSLFLQTSLPLCRSCCSYANWFHLHMKRGLYQNKVTCSIISSQRPSHLAHSWSCEMGKKVALTKEYYCFKN